jgi:hypothetical protein
MAVRRRRAERAERLTRNIIAATLLMLPCVGARAQGVTTAGIHGRVSAEARQDVDARVRVSHDATGFAVEVHARGGRFLMDLSGIGGVDGARVTGTAIQHISATGDLLFQWSPFDHFAITDGDPRDRNGADVNWTHGNSLDLASDGNLLVSFRNLGEITKIDVSTGDVIWRLGGRRNGFTFLDAPDAVFVGQHSVRSYAPGGLALLDNLGNPAESRAKRYALDEQRLAARLVRSYGSAPGVVTQIGGSVQDLPGGRLLVSIGTAGRVEEYDAAGHVMWRIEQGAAYVFRAQRITSLYAPGVDVSR